MASSSTPVRAPLKRAGATPKGPAASPRVGEPDVALGGAWKAREDAHARLRDENGALRASLLAARAEIASLTVAHAALAKQHEAARAEQGATLADARALAAAVRDARAREDALSELSLIHI